MAQRHMDPHGILRGTQMRKSVYMGAAETNPPTHWVSLTNWAIVCMYLAASANEWHHQLIRRARGFKPEAVFQGENSEYFLIIYIRNEKIWRAESAFHF